MSLEIVGDRWSLLVMRDLLFKGRRTFQEFLAGGEDIASNVLADRLAQLQRYGVIARERDPVDGRRINYRPTLKGLSLAPVLVEMIIWAAQYEATSAPADQVAAMKANRARFIRQATSRATAALTAPSLRAASTAKRRRPK